MKTFFAFAMALMIRASEDVIKWRTPNFRKGSVKEGGGDIGGDSQTAGYMEERPGDVADLHGGKKYLDGAEGEGFWRTDHAHGYVGGEGSGDGANLSARKMYVVGDKEKGIWTSGHSDNHANEEGPGDAADLPGVKEYDFGEKRAVGRTAKTDGNARKELGNKADVSGRKKYVVGEDGEGFGNTGQPVGLVGEELKDGVDVSAKKAYAVAEEGGFFNKTGQTNGVEGSVNGANLPGTKAFVMNDTRFFRDPVNEEDPMIEKPHKNIGGRVHTQKNLNTGEHETNESEKRFKSVGAMMNLSMKDQGFEIGNEETLGGQIEEGSKNELKASMRNAGKSRLPRLKDLNESNEYFDMIDESIGLTVDDNVKNVHKSLKNEDETVWLGGKSDNIGIESVKDSMNNMIPLVNSTKDEAKSSKNTEVLRVLSECDFTKEYCPFAVWKKIDGKMKQIAVSADGNHVWGVNSDNQNFHRNGLSGTWEVIEGTLMQVSVNEDGKEVWGVDAEYEIYHFNEITRGWETVHGSLRNVVVSADGQHLWGTNILDSVYYRLASDNQWTRKWEHKMKQLSVTGDGQYIWGTDPEDNVLYRNGIDGNWIDANRKLSYVTVSANGQHVWGVTKENDVRYRNGLNGFWTWVPGKFKQISVSADSDHVWAITSANDVYYRRLSIHRFKQISCSMNCNHIWGISPSNEIFYRSGMDANWVRRLGVFEQVTVSADGDHVWAVNHNKIFHSKGSDGHFKETIGQPQHISQVSVSSHSEHIWGVDSKKKIYHREGLDGNWVEVIGKLKQVVVSADGEHIYGINSEEYVLHRKRSDTEWGTFLCDLKLRQVSVNADGSIIMGTNNANDVIYYNRTNEQWKQVHGLKLKQVSISAESYIIGVDMNDKFYHDIINSQGCPNNSECIKRYCLPKNAQCKADNNGLFMCQCNEGFEAVKYNQSEQETQGQYLKCLDIDECKELDPYPCTESNTHCKNTLGGFECHCDKDYHFTAPNVTHVRTGEACTPNHGSCKVIEGVRKCYCNEGYISSGADTEVVFEGEHCLDIDECHNQELINCPDHSHCRNTNGGYECICDKGYKILDSDTKKCVEKDMCSDPDLYSCPGSSICISTAAGYDCQCKEDYINPEGNQYERKQTVFDVIDESESIKNGVDMEKVRRHLGWTEYASDRTQAWIKCSGSEFVTSMKCKGNDCDDLKIICEKLTDQDLHFVSRRYTNWFSEEQKYRICPTNYFMTGIQCSGTRCDNINLECTQFEGLEWEHWACGWTDYFSEEHGGVAITFSNRAVTGVSCRGDNCDNKQLYMCDVKDIDECNQNTFTCPSNSHCENAKPGYFCKCNDGYEKKWNRCYDINECSHGTHKCQKNSHCVNTDGDYSCPCNKGYYKTSKGCEDIDECNTVKCPNNSYCKNTDGSYECLCNHGYLSSISKTVLVKEGGTCEKMDFFDMVVGSTRVIIKISKNYQNSVNEGNIQEFELEMYQREGSKKQSEVYGAHGQTLSKDEAFSGYQVHGLEPGCRYYITLKDKSRLEFDHSVSVVTHCSCNNEKYTGHNNEEYTGQPRNFHLHQEEGHVMFHFNDASMCEEAYAFTREKGSSSKADDREKEVFTPNYFFFSRQPCAENPVSPGHQASDDLQISQLTVGQTYTYCVRAVAKDYMHNPFDESEPNLSSSDEICTHHELQWEASIKGKITLKQVYGNLPVKDVFVMWEFFDEEMDVIACGVQKTKENGQFKIAMKLSEDLKNSVLYPVRITIAKQSRLIKHKFLCDEGTVDCTDTGTTLHLHHLQFNTPLHIIDATSVSFTGKVVVADTKLHKYDDGCGLIGADVCLYTKNVGYDDTKSVCVETNALGEYEAAAVIGSRVTVRVFYHNHTFVPLSTDYWDKWENGILIEGHGVYERNDFKDITKTNLIVEVAGGLCNKTLGDSFIEVSISGGCKWTKIYTQNNYYWEHWAPAQILDVRIAKVVDIDSSVLYHVQAALNQIETIDLREIDEDEIQKSSNHEGEKENESKGNASESEEIEQKLHKTVRFQFDGELIMHLIMTKDKNRKSCNQIEGYMGDCDSLHVLEDRDEFELTVKVEYLLIKSRSVKCDIAPDDMKLTIFNKLGFDGSRDDEKLKKDLSSEEIKKMEVCWGGCDVPVVHDEVNQKNSNAHVTQELMTGLPKISGKHVKLLIVEAAGKSHIACVIIIGIFKIESGPSFGLPTHEPLLIIRDPPGGLSYASYENIETTIKLSMDSIEEYFGFEYSMKNGIGSDLEGELCLGALSILCVKNLKIEDFQGGGTEMEYPYLKNYEENTFSEGFTTTWSYTTSDDPWVAGKSSDTFVVPNINIQFDKTIHIQWNSSQCTPLSKNIITFDVKSKENKPALSFLSSLNIEKYQIPKLKDLIKNLEAQKADEKDQKEIDNIENKRKFAQDALDGWVKAWNDYEKTNELQIQNELKNMTIKNWFYKMYMNNEDNDDTISEDEWPSDHWNSLLPEELVNGADSLNPDSLSGTDHENIDLSDTNRIHFSGGGNVMELSMKHARIAEHIRKIGSKDDNKKFAAHRYGGFDMNLFLIGKGVRLSNFFGSIDELTKSTKGGDENESETQVSFVLGDEQVSDEFVVDISFDEEYGTLMFHTVSGHSRCPNELNTLPVEDPRIEVTERPTKEILPDEDMVFQLRLSNEGVGSSAFELFVDHRENIGELSHDIGGGNLARPLQYDAIAPGQEIFTMLSIKRGPVLFKYPPITLYFRSACEGVDNIGDGNNLVDPIFHTQKVYNKGTDDSAAIVFAHPCPKVRFAGDLQEEHSFLVNFKSSEQSTTLPVTIFNSDYSRGNFSELTKSDRLKEVMLMYREVGEIRWNEAKMKEIDSGGDINLVSVDFASAGEEDDYGYVTLEWAWDYSGIYDGIYELRIESRCKHIEGAPDHFNTYVTSPIAGVIDRIRPEQYGSPYPLRSFVWPGEEIAIGFTERILCEKPFHFNLKVSVSGMTNRTFDSRNLNIICEQRRIAFTFRMTEVFSKMMGETISVTLEDVKDVNGNTMRIPIKFSKPVANLNLDEASTSFVFTLEQNCTEPVGEDMKAGIQKKIASLLSLSSLSRIQVSNAVCKEQEKKVIAHIYIQTDKTKTGRRLHGPNNAHSLDLFQSLVKITTSEKEKKMKKEMNVNFSVNDLFITPGSSDMKHLEDIMEKTSHRSLSRRKEATFDDMTKVDQMYMQNHCNKQWKTEIRTLEHKSSFEHKKGLNSLKEDVKMLLEKVEAFDEKVEAFDEKVEAFDDKLIKNFHILEEKLASKMEKRMKEFEDKLSHNVEQQIDSLGDKLHEIFHQLLA